MAPLKTECNVETYSFGQLDRRQVLADFSGGQITNDGGLILIAQIDQQYQISERLACLFCRPPGSISGAAFVGEFGGTTALWVRDIGAIMLESPATTWPERATTSKANRAKGESSLADYLDGSTAELARCGLYSLQSSEA